MTAATIKEQETVAKTVDVSDAEEVEEGGQHMAGGAKKKNKKKKKKLAEASNSLPEQKNEHLRIVTGWPAVEQSRQTNPPTIPADKCFHKGSYPEGEVSQHPGANGAQRMTSAEKREKDQVKKTEWDDYRRAAEAHRQTRKFVQEFLRPGLTTLEVVQALEAKSRDLVNARGLEAGYAFPTGISINHCAAHYTPNYGEAPVILKYDDVVKIDFGVHVNGRVVDSAFTVAFDERFDNLLMATKDGTNTGLKEAGADARHAEIGAAIAEAISSYELELNGKTYPIKPIANLNGHTVEQYKVHGSKSLPIVKTDTTEKMEEGEVYAIETFASTGRGKVEDEGVCSHYMLNPYAAAGQMKIPHQQGATQLFRGIKDTFGTLAWCRRWLDDNGHKRHLLALKALVDEGIVDEYKPLCDVEGSYTSQFEHTIMLRPTCKEIVTRGPDY
eukprot:Blabericola_migrator_1__1460@NODE_1385_length_4665_cov_90_290126_g927_i0_p1_GENE_NODE_1385_length_4665_cov_90_290126_g927_i0NODE_1385_length_4665_cov_90_290126_g927_i0_p1_ORF_typecomplete_len442_score97_89Peptidase_M24/PF00557_24/5_1e39_NODE_1385_length_4665_cov_90_290126_g927_i032454570